MIKLLLILAIPALLLGGGYFYINYTTSGNLENPTEGSRSIDEPIEVPKTLPGQTESEGKEAETAVTPNLKTPTPSAVPIPQTSSLDSKVAALETVVNDLKLKIANLEKATPAPASSSKTTIYIPLGSGGYWGNSDWYSLVEYEISLDPANYPGYTGMQLEVIFRLVEAVGTGYVRLFNITDNSATSSEISTTSTTFALKTTSSFTLPSGSKTYKLQIKSSVGKDLYIQSARIKVNF